MRTSSSPRVRGFGNTAKRRRSSQVAGRTAGFRHARLLISAPLLRRFERYLQKHALSPATIRNYLADLRAFSRWHEERKRFGRGLAVADFRAYREHLCNETGHSPATVNRRLQSLRLFGRFLHETGQSPENPTRDLALLRNGNRNGGIPRTLTSGEVTRLLDAVHAARPSLESRDMAIVQVMLQTGLRVHEVGALRVEDVVIARHRPRVQVCGSQQNARRTVPLNTTVVRALRDYLAVRPTVPRVDHLFLSQRGQPLSVRSIQRLVDTYARAADLRDVSAQSLRHTCAKRMLEETHDAVLVARWLGHRDTRTLVRYLR